MQLARHRIRNYIGKDWFLKMTLQAEPTPLAHTISSILKKPTESLKDKTDCELGVKVSGNGHATINGD